MVIWCRCVLFSRLSDLSSLLNTSGDIALAPNTQNTADINSSHLEAKIQKLEKEIKELNKKLQGTRL